MSKQRPILKWAGGKYRCLDKILSHLPAAKRLIEPFAGSGAVTLNTAYPCYLMADINSDLITLYQFIQQEGLAFIQECESYFIENNNSPEQYYLLRNRFNQSQDPRERAVLFLYLNRHGYNGLCRYNLQGKYNVPFGRYKKPYFPKQELLHFYQKTKHTVFVFSDFVETFAKAKKGDVIYCDPPYAPIVQATNFSAYSKNRFGEKEQLLLAKLASDTAQRGIPVIISNHDTPITRQYYRLASVESFKVSRTINSNTGLRRPIQELIAIFT